jgi:hypothetical protein
MTEYDRFLQAARRLGFRIRYEWLDGQGAAVCRIKSQDWLFLDLACGPAEQLDAICKSIPDRKMRINETQVA